MEFDAIFSYKEKRKSREFSAQTVQKFNPLGSYYIRNFLPYMRDTKEFGVFFSPKEKRMSQKFSAQRFRNSILCNPSDPTKSDPFLPYMRGTKGSL